MMKTQVARINDANSVSALGECLDPRVAVVFPGGELLPIAAQPGGNNERREGPSDPPPLPSIPASPAPSASKIPIPSPVADTGSAATELPSLVPQPFSAFGSLSQFKDAQRMALLLARSSLVPEGYRGEAHLGDCLLALEIANRIGASILAVMQNLQPVRGKLGWSSQFLISCVNASKRFSPLRYQMTGTRGEDSWGCIAWAHDKTGELLQSPEVTLRTAKQEGWYYRPGSKWRTMPELMLRYRSATLFARLYAPELTMGIQTTEEVVEMSAEGNPPVTRPSFEAESSKRKLENRFNPETHVEVPINSKAPPTSAGLSPRAGSGPEPAATQDALATPLPRVEPQALTCRYNYLKALNGLIGLSPHSEADVLSYLTKVRRCDASLASLAELAQQDAESIVWTHDHWSVVEQELAQLRKGQTP